MSVQGSEIKDLEKMLDKKETEKEKQKQSKKSKKQQKKGKKNEQQQKKQQQNKTSEVSANDHPFFLHLPQNDVVKQHWDNIGFTDSSTPTTGPVEQAVKVPQPIHPAIIKLGLQYTSGRIVGSNARCVALLTALKQVIRDYETPADKAMSRDFDSKLKPLINFIKKCRPMSVSMGNAIKYFKVKVHKLDPTLSEDKAKEELIEWIDTFIFERIKCADKVISEHGISRINDGDVILSYARSSVVERTFKKAKDAGKQFTVVILDSRPLFEGRKLMRSLLDYGIECSYALINSVSHMMKDINKVFLGAHTLLCNGNLVSRTGTAGVAMMAHCYNVPVVVCCETYKFSEKAQLDAICANELLDADILVQDSKLKSWRHIPNLKVLSLAYDLTPINCIDMVITEVGMVPPSSVPVIIREYRKEQ
eukprot:gb/GECH01014359.1/.p1 GENE.gb/GECH01014359.1/~~gb/GECH01014359.1/.p1  ORF type:complete len:420 (+),score=108.84 gb/GECH01014359.1/:1-1260(+)